MGEIKNSQKPVDLKKQYGPPPLIGILRAIAEQEKVTEVLKLFQTK
jgi:hypothetical protein